MGQVPEIMSPVFRDREEFSRDTIENGTVASLTLIAVSPHKQASKVVAAVSIRRLVTRVLHITRKMPNMYYP